MEFNDTGKRKVYNIDLDGTLTNGEPFWKGEPTPNEAMCRKVVELYKSGNIIIIWTARSWYCAPETVAWLTKYSIPYHGIKMEKGGSDCYIDDKNALMSDILSAKGKSPYKESWVGTFETIASMPGYYSFRVPSCIERFELGDKVSINGVGFVIAAIWAQDLILEKEP